MFAYFVTSNGRGGEQGESKPLEDDEAVVYGHSDDSSDSYVTGCSNCPCLSTQRKVLIKTMNSN